MQQKFFTDELHVLKSILDKTNMTIAIKWGAEVYTVNGKNVVSYGGFKNHFCLWFYDGVFLSDPLKVLVTANEEKTKALRQWRFKSAEEIDENAILSYVHEAIVNAEKGLFWKPEKSGEIELPAVFIQALEKNSNLKLAFDDLTPYKRKEYVEYITSAKQEKTKLTRLEKSIPLILKGIGLNDKYR